VDKTTTWDRDEIRAGLTALVGEDPSRQRRYELEPALSEGQVRLFEQRYNVTLPESYRSFVTAVGDGGAGPQHGLWPLNRAYGPEETRPGGPGS
jgi:hypothetical protein